MYLRCLALSLSVTILAGAQTVNPSAYSTTNGALGPAGALWWDDIYRGTGDSKADASPLSGGLGQLSDGSTGCGDDPATDCGSGAGYDWVGWKTDPTITFQFGQRCDFRTIRIYTANLPDAGVRLWKTATISFSDDGHTFRDFVLRTTTPEEQQEWKARYINIPARMSGQFVRIHLIRADPSAWTTISEVLFEGRIARDQAPPAKPR